MSKLFLLAILILTNSSMGAEKQMRQLIPENVQDWKRPDNDEIYTRETLFHHINGGAELYLLYGFKQVLVRRFVKTGNPDRQVTKACKNRDNCGELLPLCFPTHDKDSD